MNTLIITEAELIIKGDATVQLRISAVLLRKPGRWDAPYASQGKYHQIKNADFMRHFTASISSNVTLFISFSKTLVAN